MTLDRKTRIVKLAQERRKRNLGKVLGVTAASAAAGGGAGWGASALIKKLHKLSPKAQARWGKAFLVGTPILAGAGSLGLVLRNEKRKEMLGV